MGNEENNNDFFSKLSYKKELEEKDRLDALAKKIKSGEVNIENLDEEVLVEMIDYFNEDIENKKQELEKIKNQIIKIRKELANGQN